MDHNRQTIARHVKGEEVPFIVEQRARHHANIGSSGPEISHSFGGSIPANIDFDARTQALKTPGNISYKRFQQKSTAHRQFALERLRARGRLRVSSRGAEAQQRKRYCQESNAENT